MATIPIGNFGQSLASPQPLARIPQGNPVGDAQERTGQIATGILNEGAQVQLQQKEALQRAQAGLSLATAGNALKDAHAEVERGVIDGTIAPDRAAAEFKDRSSKALDGAFDGVTPEQRANMQSHLAGVSGELNRSLSGVVQKRQQMDLVGTLDQFGEQVSREGATKGPDWPVQKYGAMVDFIGPTAGLNDQQRARLKQAFSQRTHATFYENAANGALMQGDATALGHIVEQLQGPDGDPLDPEKRAQLTHQIFGWQQSVLAQQASASNRAEQAARVRDNAAVDLYNKATDVALGGGYLSPDFITDLTKTAAGTSVEKDVTDLIASQRTVAGFASSTFAQREALIQSMEAQRATPGHGTDPLNDKLLTAMKTMEAKLVAGAKENPWAVAPSALRASQSAPVLNAADPSSWIQTMQWRIQNIGEVENWAGHKVSPLQPVEVEQLSKLVKQLPVDQAASVLSAFGAAIGDPERIAALGKQMHDKDGTLGLAMMYASDKTTQGRYAAELVLRGDQALKDNSVIVDKAAQTGWKGTIAGQIRGTYSNREAEDNYIDAAFKIAAAKYVQNGSVDLPEAVKLATGGIIERNGQKLPLPWGMREAEFTKRIEALTPADLQAQAPNGQVFVAGIPMALDKFVGTLPQAMLIDAGEGRYNVRAGNQLVTNASGARITIKVNP